MSVWRRMIFANISVVAWNCLIMIAGPLGLYRLPHTAFFITAYGGAAAVWGTALAVTFLVRGDA